MIRTLEGLGMFRLMILLSAVFVVRLNLTSIEVLRELVIVRLVWVNKQWIKEVKGLRLT